MVRHNGYHRHGLVVVIAHRVAVTLRTVVTAAGRDHLGSVVEVTSGSARQYEAYLTVITMGMHAYAIAFVQCQPHYLILFVEIHSTLYTTGATQHVWQLLLGNIIKINHK